MIDPTTFHKIWDSSLRVIADGALENGAIVAANAFKSYYPKAAKHYFYVWPRDASYVCMAADLALLKGIQEPFFDWCLNRAEGFQDNGLFYEKYYVNGLKAGSRFQPDQTASLLVALHHHYRWNLQRAERYWDLIEKAADGLVKVWEKNHFIIVANDLWEERLAFPDLEENLTYSLAACIRGLECAGELLPERARDWYSVSQEMRRRLDVHFLDGSFVRSFGKLIDRSVDASLLGLVYPFGVCKAEDPRMTSTVQEMERRLVKAGGVYRYASDQYDGWFFEGGPRNKGAGAWPLLNFWMSIYYSLKGERDKAEGYFWWVLDKVDEHIPEQIFDNPLQVSVSPLLWSHAMFIISSKFLGCH